MSDYPPIRKAVFPVASPKKRAILDHFDSDEDLLVYFELVRDSQDR